MSCVEKLPHSCGSSDGLQVFVDDEGQYTGYCFACSEYVPNPYLDKPEGYAPTVLVKTQEEIDAELAEVADYRPLALPTRDLKTEYLSYYNTVVSVSEGDGLTPERVYFPYSNEAYKVRLLEPKRQWVIGKFPPPMLFGWEQAVDTGTGKLYITEGEFDAIALFQILKETAKGTAYESYNPAVVSLPIGAAGAVKTITALLPEIRKCFNKGVVLVFDQDKAGKEAVEKVMQIAPDFISATLPAKDANTCLMEGRSKACRAAVLFNASAPKNTRILRGSSLAEQAMKKPKMGRPWPWDKLTRATRGRRPGETLYFGAGVKMGKSELVNSIGEPIMSEEDMPVFFAKPEEAPVKTYQMLVGKAAHRIFHDPTIEFDEEAFLKAEPLIGDKALIMDVYQFVGWDQLKQDIRYAVVGEGCKDVIIDPITCLTNQMSSGDANEHLTAVSAELSAMAKDLDFTAYIFCHLKAPDGTPHERGGHVVSNQFAGSRAMMRSCNYMIGLEGNKDPDLPKEERNLRDLVILEDREFGVTDRVPLYWDDKTGMFNEI